MPKFFDQSLIYKSGVGLVAYFEYVKTVKPGDKFRDWLIKMLGNRVLNKDCEVRVFKLSHASHQVCKYELKGENYSVVVKFFALPTGIIKNYDSYSLMKKEYENLKKAWKIIDVPEPIGINKDFNCALVSKYVAGRPLFWYFKHRRDLKEKLELVANMLRKLHENTQTYYDIEEEFLKFNYVLDHLKVSRHIKSEFKELLRKWKHSSLLDMKNGCMIHNDSNPMNFMFHNGRSFLLDFELASRHGHLACDLGILCAELKYYFTRKGASRVSEFYIHHFLRHYCKDNEEFQKITIVIPFYMAYGLLRIALLKSNSSYKDVSLRKAKRYLNVVNYHSTKS